MENKELFKNYTLKKYDKPIINFNVIKEDLGDYKIFINSITNDKEDLPNGVNDGKTLYHWLKKRTIPKNRAFVAQILKNQNIEPNDFIELLNVSKALSLNDVYWVVGEDFKGSFDNYNLYENDFSEILSLIAYTGQYNASKDSPISPEWTTSGNLPKCWRRENGKLYLYKAGTSKEILENREGFEPYSEFYISKILDYLKIEHINYDLIMFKNKLASICECFCDKRFSLVPMCDIIKSGEYSELKKFVVENGFQKDFSNMILIDALTYNEDRHYNNFGVIKDNITNKFIKLAPIYDNGLGLFSYLSDYSLLNEERFKDEKERANISNWGFSHSTLLLNNLSENTMKNLINMKNYAIEKHNKYNLSDERLQILNKTINDRALELIELIKENQKEVKNDVLYAKVEHDCGELCEDESFKDTYINSDKDHNKNLDSNS